MSAGQEITRGTRYIMVGFVKVRDAPLWRLFGMLGTRFHVQRASGGVEQDEEVVVKPVVSEAAFLFARRFENLWEAAGWPLYAIGGLVALFVCMGVWIGHDYYVIWRLKANCKRSVAKQSAPQDSDQKMA
jgi:hypothetical protein